GAWYKGRWYDQNTVSALQQPLSLHSSEFASSFTPWASRPAAYQRAQGKELRRARRANLLMQADQAISSGSSGSILTPEEELDTMRKHFTQDSSLPVDSRELQVFLDKLPARKAPLQPPDNWAKVVHRLYKADFRSAWTLHQHLTIPLLFAAFMTLVTRRLSSRLTTEWVERCLTMFADDFHIGQCFHSYHELETLSSRIGYIMSTLRNHGMSVHATKAKAIITIEGTKRSTAVKKLVRTSEDGKLFRIHTKQGDEFLPLVRQADYLGAVTTYDSHASATLRRRTLLAKDQTLAGHCVAMPGVWLGGMCPAHITHESDIDLLVRSRMILMFSHTTTTGTYTLPAVSRRFLSTPLTALDTPLTVYLLVSVSIEPAPQKGVESFGSVLVAAGKRGTEEKPTGAPQGKGFQGKGGRRRPGKNQNGRPQSDSGNSSFLSGSTTDGEDAELLHLVARAIVRHEDTLNVLRRSTGWVFWIRSGDHSILPTLVDLASKWREVAEKQEIQADHISLRVTLLWGIFTTLKEKLSHLSQEQLAYANRASWIDTSSNWNFQRWDPQHQMLIVDTSRPPLSLAQIQESLATLLRVINGDTLTRFAATKGISADTQGT
ncbi:unnamed protein product, partial [Symbiodinium necroappetens]